MVNPLDIAVADFLDVLDNVSPNLDGGLTFVSSRAATAG